MLRDRGIRRIKYLMIFSQALITVFVIYWLAERYDYEKTELHKSLLREFEIAEQKMLDTLIRAKMIDHIQVVKTKNNSKVALISATNSKSVVSVPIGKTQNVGSAAGKNDSIEFKFDVKFDKSVADTSTTVDSVILNPQKNINIINAKQGSGNVDLSSEKIMIEGVKVFMSIVSDSSGNKSSKRVIISEGLDTSILKKNFGQVISNRNLEPLWITGDDSTELGRDEIFFYSNMLDGKYGVLVKNHQLAIVRSLANNILFSALLLLITGAAFIISYINLKKQQQLNKIRDEFVGNITHELKTPVATVKVALEALNKFNIKDNPAKSSEYINIATLELDRLNFLIQKVLTSSIYGSNSNASSLEIVNLDDILTDVIKTMQIRFEIENASVTKECNGTDFSILADRIHIQGVIINLIDNSLKYTNGKPTIHINLNSLETTIILSVSDDGIGIPAEYQNRIFDKFFRVPNDNKHNVKGHGLGLSYVEMVMKQHSGAITVKNNPAKGCTFTVTFPKAKNQ